LAVRIRHAEPKVIISASCGLEPNRIVEYKPSVDEAIKLAGMEVKSLVLQREQWQGKINPGDLLWQEEVAAAAPHDCVPLEASRRVYSILWEVTRW